MTHALYDEMVPWYRLLDPRDDHEPEADAFTAGIRSIIGPGPATLLELGAGAGNNGFFMKRDFRCTLTDPAPGMLALSREINPDCEHALGDMRDMRLGRTFDAVLVHDAIVYMRTEDALREALQTAFVHTRPGGAAIFAPDIAREDFAEFVDDYEGADGARAMRCLVWVWDPDPTDSTYRVDYNFLLRQGGAMRSVHEVHVEGLFDTATWTRLLQEVGYTVDRLVRPLGEGEDDPGIYLAEVFLCRRPIETGA